MELNKDSGDEFLALLEVIGAEDAAGLKKAALSYGNSWKSRGGVGAFMMLARKWDRLENRVRGRNTTGLSDVTKVLELIDAAKRGDNHELLQNVELVEQVMRSVAARTYDIFWHIANDPRAEGVIDDVRDLRRYLMLVEAEMRARGFDATHRDNK